MYVCEQSMYTINVLFQSRGQQKFPSGLQGWLKDGFSSFSIPFLNGVELFVFVFQLALKYFIHNLSKIIARDLENKFYCF